MDITMIGLQNAGKTSLLRVLAVSCFAIRPERELTLRFLRAESSPLSEQASFNFSRPRVFELMCYSLLQLDSNSRVQYEKGPKRPCNPEMVLGPHFCNVSALCSNLDLAGT